MRKEDVLLEAVSTAPIEDEFLVQAFEIEANRPAQEDVEILKRDMHGMREMQVGEPGRGRGRRRGQFDPVRDRQPVRCRVSWCELYPDMLSLSTDGLEHDSEVTLPPIDLRLELECVFRGGAARGV